MATDVILRDYSEDAEIHWIQNHLFMLKIRWWMLPPLGVSKLDRIGPNRPGWDQDRTGLAGLVRSLSGAVRPHGLNKGDR